MTHLKTLTRREFRQSGWKYRRGGFAVGDKRFTGFRRHRAAALRHHWNRRSRLGHVGTDSGAAVFRCLGVCWPL